MLAVTAGASAGNMACHKGALLLSPGVTNPLKAIFRPEKRVAQEDLASYLA
jgi:hypothetical protein